VRLVFRAYWEVIRFDAYLMRRDFAGLCGAVRDCRTDRPVTSDAVIERICAAVDLACIWYWKQALCLQRSAVTARLLKQHGVPAELVIGVQTMPVRAHAWVEVGRAVVNDRPYIRDIYTVLDRC
jgi:Transglutaminase-like superfamily